ncbi:hypothetical protein AB7V88_00525 [Providencia rettgeri]
MKHQIIMRIIGSEQGLITKDLSNSKNDAILINSISYSREKDENGTPILRLTKIWVTQPNLSLMLSKTMKK